jgi:hypothetical protein
VIVRDYIAEDQTFIAACHKRSGFEYRLPNFAEETCLARKVVLGDSGPVAAAMACVTVEIYGYSDETWGTPGMRLAALKLLHASIEEEMRKQKIKTAHAWLPPGICKSFARRLQRTFGWFALDHSWQCMVKNIG